MVTNRDYKTIIFKKISKQKSNKYDKPKKRTKLGI